MQERAVRTRQALLAAAADEFAEHGYEGASFQGVVWRATTSIGSLTFHFGTKTTLAEEVHRAGHARVGRCLEAVAAPADPLRGLIGLIGRLARLAHEDPFVRAAHRLEADGRPGGVPPLAELWLPVLRELLDRAHRARRLRPGVSLEDAVALLAHLADGAMGARDATRDSVWDIVLHGLAADRTGRMDRMDRAGRTDLADQAERADRADSMWCGSEPT
ncbi:TetR/AcrR family transcriptional regulator [Streptomyces coelicoflavus]|uniref:TetR/AcrR family transcriptional regulator n=1 Tax=Streptomyces coelicoflavus TaxID=285562 RepID=A0A7K3PSQ6_9ACTN|nr:TetR/AcrR family transcriptional regulator [Streptomyces coelicoflavus]NEB13000.1 TetR/AcrR family transcriptional regulator [Streptomyces coelicoflavus]